MKNPIVITNKIKLHSESKLIKQKNYATIIPPEISLIYICQYEKINYNKSAKLSAIIIILPILLHFPPYILSIDFLHIPENFLGLS